MRLPRAVVLAGLFVTGCAGFRQTAVPPPVDLELAPGLATELGCVRHPRIDAWERRLRARPWRTWMREDVARGARYLPRVREMVIEAGLPASLALLPAIESGFRPDARGRRGERGLWQLRVGTARRFGLEVDRRADERTRPEDATRAAVRYLRFLHARYGDWPLALAAYNAGEGRVNRALQRWPMASFWDLAEDGRLPRESRDYVSHFLAVVRLHAARCCDAPSPLLASSGSLG